MAISDGRMRVMKLVSHERKKEGARDDYATPQELFDLLDTCYQIDIDVAASCENAKCCNFIDKLDDALARPWNKHNSGTAFCNPPFSQWQAFMHKAVIEAKHGMTVVFLVPPRVETSAWHMYAPKADEIIFLQGRVSFLLDGEPKNNNGAASAILIFRPRLEHAAYGTPRMTFWDWKSAIETRKTIKTLNDGS